MIERKFVDQNKKEYLIQRYIKEQMRNVGHSATKLQKTPMGDKIVITVSRPGLIVGSHGQNIKRLTIELKREFGLENPQIEITEVPNVNLDAQVVAERIASSMERFGSQRFKGIMHKSVSDVMAAGAKGIEVLISGKVPSARSRTWRVYSGYLKKCGDTALVGVYRGHTTARLKSGVVGVKVSIMPPTTKMPDDIKVTGRIEEEIKEAKPVDKKKKPAAKKKTTAKKSSKESEAQKELKKNLEKVKKEDTPKDKKENEK
ncbi:30S ribosomal protein S3 [Candidatus Woesearchaeota archaeon]|jgi:small subunit ribosomal protein S3|nr:30S ribosomal protein S3 [Candidatus Woesearchaeota archaeon]MBT3537443.1 30S ribosomal protein S3 [Candidatus Woesearchaeota archaeon]MBT4697756.1 30S ribosomal protein S3 [Candidatus Woesearchaeota archaeon]MBT4717557.1 30S ribosomal protein S3 [Candidatus Woesearchaeota archaeon]MBT7106247.1 30S ribosomal protein S3 [Candidatus Woesearchaeota archaeon]